MKQLGIVGEPLVPGKRAILAASTQRFAENLRTEVREPGSEAHSPADGVAAPKSGPPDNGEVNVQLTLLQRMIQEILDPLSLPRRSVKDWRRLYKTFFAFFAPDGSADKTEREAFEVASSVFNTDLVAVCNRTTKILPMTFQDFVDGVDSFRHDGLREGAQRDIAWQPKKILLLMASMIGRIVAGWQADALVRGSSLGLVPFRNYLIEANRKASFLGTVFDFDPRFSVLQYRAAGLKPLLQAFPHFAVALMENGMFRCEFCPPQEPQNPPLLRAHFLKPLRTPRPLGTLPTLHLVLLRKAPPLAAEGGNAGAESSYFEFSTTVLNSLTFKASDAPETKWPKLEKLFELAVTEGLMVCAAHRADASTAARISRALGRTQAESFVIERFFALGFRSGHGNEPWLERAASALPTHDPTKVKKAQKQFGRWKTTGEFFLRAGQPQAAEFAGASHRREALQPKGSSIFLSLLHTTEYAPLLGLFVAADAEGKWLIDEPELHAFARNLNRGVGNILAEASELITRYADSLRDNETKAVFLFECAAGIMLTASGGHNDPKRLACLQRATAALRLLYEQSFGVTLSRSPSVLRGGAGTRTAQLAQTKNPFEEAEQTIMGLLTEPLNRKVSEKLRVVLEQLPKPGTHLSELAVPPIRLENRTAFDESIVSLCAWVKSTTRREPDAAPPSASRFLTDCVELRGMAEEGRLEGALAKSTALYPTLGKAEKEALAPLFGELAWSLLQEIEGQLHHGNHEKAAALAQKVTVIIERTPLRDDFKSLFQTLFAPRRATEFSLPPVPATGVSEGNSGDAMVHQAEVLLRDHADELGMAENQLEKDFLLAVIEGSVGAFRRKEKLRSRLQRRTHWGGREPYRTILRLLQASSGRET